VSAKPEKVNLEKFIEKFELDLAGIPNDSPDDKVSLEKEVYEIAKLQAELDIIQTERDILRDERKERKEYTGKIFYLIVYWLCTILLLLILDSIDEIDISDNVMIALVSGTTASVIGIFHFALKYIYRLPEKKEKS